MASVVEKDGSYYAVTTGGELYKSQFSDALEQLPLIGDLIHSDTVSVDLTSGSATVDFLDMLAPIPGEYAVELSFSDPAINSDMNATVRVGNVATGSFILAAYQSPPGDHLIDTTVDIQGLDVQSNVDLIVQEAEEVMFHDATNVILENYVMIDEDTLLFIDGGQNQVQKYDQGSTSLIYTNSIGITDMKKDKNNDVFLVNSPQANNIQWIDENGNSLQIKDFGSLHGFSTIRFADVNSLNHMLVFGKIGGGDWGIYQVDNSTDTIVDQWNNVPVETNMWVTDNDRVYILGTSIFEFDLSNNTGTLLRTNIKRETGEGSRNGVAICTETTLFTDPAIGEETELFLGATRKNLVYNIDDMTNLPNSLVGAEPDYESLMFDKQSSSLLIYDHLLSSPGYPGRIIKIPVNCGKLFVELVIVDGQKTMLSDFDIIPDQVIQVSDDQTEYRWVIDQLGQIQQILNFKTQVNDLLPNESRPILEEAFLVFKSDINPEITYTNNIEIPTVLGVTNRTVTVSLDESNYESNTDVIITNTINNSALLGFDGSLSQWVVDANGQIVDTLPAVDVINLSPSGQLINNYTWNTGTYFAGNYEILTQLTDLNGDIQNETVTPFTIVPDGANNISAQLLVLANQFEYSPVDVVEINAHVTNQSVNDLLTSSTLELVVTAPDNSIISQESFNVNSLLPGGSQHWQSLIVLNDASIGTYTVTINLLSDQAQVVATENTSFDVITNPQVLISGNVVSEYNMVFPGTNNSCLFSITNNSANTISNLEVEALLVNLTTQNIDYSSSQFISLLPSESWQQQEVFITDNLSNGDYACLIRSTFEDITITHGSTVFDVDGLNVISGIIFDDFLGDGMQNVNDVGIENVLVQLIDSQGSIIDSTTTFSDGGFSIENVFNGHYTIEIDELGVLDSAVSTTANNNLELIIQDNNYQSAFGYQYFDSSLVGLIWNDENDNGIVDNGESGFENITVQLTDSNQNLFIATTINNGNYLFSDIPSGSFQLSVTDENSILDGFRNTTENEPLSFDVFSHSQISVPQVGYRLDVFDLNIFTTNCTTGLIAGQEITYQVRVRNLGNTDIIGGTVENLVPVGLSNVIWSCDASSGSMCTPSGIDDIQDLVNVQQGGELNYLITGTVTGQLFDIISQQVTVSMPIDLQDGNTDDNYANDHDMILDLVFIDAFDCSAPTDGQSINQLLMKIIFNDRNLN